MIANNASAIVGANTGKRRANDFYPTPDEVTVALLRFLEIPEGSTIWEPACGHGDMVRTMQRHGYNVYGTDIQYGVDFLQAELPRMETSWIITNPPFFLADKFIKRCIFHERNFALLLKATYWNAKSRQRLFEENPPHFVLPLTWRPDFTGQKASLMDMIWCVWYGKNEIGYSLFKPLEKPR